LGPYFGLCFVDLHRYQKNSGTLIRHDIRVTHLVHPIFEIAFGNIREPLIPAAQDKDMEPLDEQADKRDDAITQRTIPIRVQ
jgi:hypothetical protein